MTGGTHGSSLARKLGGQSPQERLQLFGNEEANPPEREALLSTPVFQGRLKDRYNIQKPEAFK